MRDETGTLDQFFTIDYQSDVIIYRARTELSLVTQDKSTLSPSLSFPRAPFFSEITV